jgi:PIN like domain
VSSRSKLATVRFYFDADVLGLAKLICQERADATYPGDPGGRIKKKLRAPCPVTKPGAHDEDWIPTVAERGWLIITRDRHIQDNKAELAAVRDNRAKMVNLASADARNTWAQLEVLMVRWREIEPLSDHDGPFIYIVSLTGALRQIPLE